MPVDLNELNEGRYYLTNTGQLRRIDKIRNNSRGQTVIEYSSKSVNFTGRKFTPEATKENPALDDTFASACDHELTDKEVEQLRQSNVILSGE